MLTLLRRLMSGNQRGQVVVVAVGVMALSLGAIMISVDVGWWLRDKRDAQNDADAIALAAAQELPDTGQAVAAGLDWADFNGVETSEVAEPDCADGVVEGKFCFIDQNSDGDADKVRVKVSRLSNSFIAEALGVGTPTLNPPAAASKLYGVASCILPWGIVADPNNPDPEEFYGLNPTKLYIFMESTANTPGNYGAISIYGPGNNYYTDVIESTTGCPETHHTACAQDPVVGEGETLQDCKSDPGTGGKTTAKALEIRYADSAPYDDCHAESYSHAAELADTADCGDRAVPLGIIDAFPPGGSSADISIYGVAMFYIAGWDRSPPWGDGGPDPGDPDTGYVWGYLLTSIPVTPAWQIEWDVSENPFAPVGFFLVE